MPSTQPQYVYRCHSCEAPAVAFNPYNVSVSCHACGAEEKDLVTRQKCLDIFMRSVYADAEMVSELWEWGG